MSHLELGNWDSGSGDDEEADVWKWDVYLAIEMGHSDKKSILW